MRTQARGLARAVAVTVVEKVAPARLAWPSDASRSFAENFAPPLPDLLVTCGRRSADLAARLRRRGAERMVAVHVQDPRRSLEALDLVIAMTYDRIAEGPKVIKIATALHDVTPVALAAAAETWGPRLARLGQPLTGVLIGGTTRRGAFGKHDVSRLLDGLVHLRGAGASLAITPSRRTPTRLLAALAARFADDRGVWLWDGHGDNPYRGILALADRLMVTGDSVSMMSEALATGAPVEVLDLHMPHFSRFIDPLLARGAMRPFTGDPTPPPRRAPLDATPAAAAVVRRLLHARAVDGGTGSEKDSWSRARHSSVT